MRNVVLLLTLVITTLAFPQDRTQNWPQEPDSFLGVKFGTPIWMSVHECPYKLTGRSNLKVYEAFPAAKCFEESSSGLFVLRNSGVVLFTKVFVMTKLNKVTQITTEFESGNVAQHMADSLIEKYGTPHEDHTTVVQNGYGVQLPSRTLKWTGRSVQITFMSTGADLSEGLIAVQLLADARKEPGEKKDAVRDTAHQF